MPTFSPVRAACVMILIGCVLVGLIGRVGYLQTFGRQSNVRQADRQHYTTSTLPARKGTIFDSNGAILAGTIQTRTLFVDPKFMFESFNDAKKTPAEIDAIVTKLARLLDKEPRELHQLLDDKMESRFVRVAEKLDDNVAAAIEKLDIDGVGFMPANQRTYPMGSLAAHILGSVGYECKGLEGLELQFDKTLTGKDGYKRALKDARRHALSVAPEDYLPPQHGQHLILTVDSNIQLIAEQELATICDEFKAKRGEVIVMDPKTGDILALANWPTFNPQNIDDSKPEVRRNRSLTDPYEPGSTIKPFIAGPGMAMGATKPQEVFQVNGPTFFTPYGRRVSDVHPYPQLAMWDVLVKSSNIGMCMLAERMGNANLHKSLTSFGYGKRTGIELPGEDPGLINPLRKWTKYSTDSVAQGYELMVTPLQIARGFCAYANGGKLVSPRIVKGVLDASGEVVTRSQPVALSSLPEVIDPNTASDMRRILCDVPVRGTASTSRKFCTNWNIFGKTGTAHISGGKAGYSQDKYTSSFIGGAPYEDPRIVVAFIVHEVEKNGKNYYGGTVSAPGAARIFNRTLAYLQVPQSPELLPPPPQIADVLYAFNPAAYKRPTQAELAASN